MNAAGTSLIDTLQSIDSLNGGEGKDTLNVTLNTTTAAVPELKSIEVINLRSTTAATELDLSAATGVTNVNVANSTSKATVKSVGDAALAVKDQKQAVDFDGSTATALKLDFDTVGIKGTNITVDLAKGVANKATSFDIKANNANVTLIETAAGVATTAATIAATGVNSVKLTAADLLTIKTMTVTGNGSLDLTAATAYTVLETLTTSAGVTINTTAGALKTVTATAGDNTVTAVSSKLETATFGAGKDTLTLVTDTLGATAKINMGAGDDTVTIAAASTKGAIVDGGEGKNTLAVTTSAFLDADAKDTYKNFQVLEIGTAAAQTFDLDNLTGITEVSVTGALTGAITSVNNLAAGTKINFNTATAGTTAAAGTVLGVAFKDAVANKAIEVNLNAIDSVVGNGSASGIIAAKLDTNTANIIEKVTINSNVTNIDAAVKAVNYVNTLEFTTSAGLKELVITGDASLTITGATSVLVDLLNLTKVDASASNGNITLAATTHNKAFTYIGAKGVDTVTTGTIGDTIYGGLGADQITITTNTVKDTIIYKNVAAESQLTDASKDAKITLAADKATIDKVTGFTVAMDKIELDHFDFNAYQKGAVLDLNAGTKVTTTTDLTNIADFFADTNGDRGVAKWYDGSANTYAFIDVNKDGNFTAADDMVIELVGDIALAHTDISFS